MGVSPTLLVSHNLTKRARRTDENSWSWGESAMLRMTAPVGISRSGSTFPDLTVMVRSTPTVSKFADSSANSAVWPFLPPPHLHNPARIPPGCSVRSSARRLLLTTLGKRRYHSAFSSLTLSSRDSVAGQYAPTDRVVFNARDIVRTRFLASKIHEPYSASVPPAAMSDSGVTVLPTTTCFSQRSRTGRPLYECVFNGWRR